MRRHAFFVLSTSHEKMPLRVFGIRFAGNDLVEEVSVRGTSAHSTTMTRFPCDRLSSMAVIWRTGVESNCAAIFMRASKISCLKYDLGAINTEPSSK
jgi:hypothetical protein